jgi:hypothetical protein
MGKLKNTITACDHSPKPSTGINAENYVERAQAFIRANRGEGVALRSSDAPPDARTKSLPVTNAQFWSWIEYFARIGVKTKSSRKSGVMTVPAEWPEDFDASAPASLRTYIAPPSVEPTDKRIPPIAWQSLIDQFPKSVEKWSAINDSADARDHDDPATRAAIVAHHERRLADLRAEYAASPIAAPTAEEAA